MKKLILLFLIIIIIVCAAGCGGSNSGASQTDKGVCNYGDYKCSDNSSYYCGYSGDELLWILSETCRNGCNSSTGKCKSGNNNSGEDTYEPNPETRAMSCEGLPDNAEWNTVSIITQTWNGSSWTPSNQGTYNTTASTEECHFKCKKNYSWSGTKCRADSRVSDCTGLPANAEWNTVSTITQTWNGSSWQPAAKGEYSENPSSTECRFQCIENYFWNGNACIDPCESDPCYNIDNGTGVCVGIDSVEYKCECTEGFIWNDAECIDPCSPNPCRNKENSTHNCNIDENSKELYACECLDTFAWNESSKECLNPCEPNPCIGIENSTEACIKVDNFTKYTCECEDTFTWNENNRQCLNPCEPNPCTGIENSTETCIKVDNFTKYTCECEDTFTWEENSKKCLNPCKPNPCAGIENSTETCIKVDNFTQYTCECKDTFTWEENSKKCLNPCEPNPCSGIENSPEICVKDDEFTQYSCKCYKNFVWNGSQCVCMFPECSPTSNTPCVDSTSKLIWSSISSNWMNWEEANEYCNNLRESDLANWRLPTISELRTLIKNCPATEPGGSCKVSDSCLAFSCWSEEDCSCVGIYDNEGYYSKLGDDITLWSSSTFSDMPDYAWYIGWGAAFVYGWAKVDTPDSYSPIRCVRKKTGACF